MSTALGVASTLALEDQLEVLADMHTLPHGTQPVYHDYLTQCACGNIEELIGQLRRVGIEPTDAGRYDDLTAVRSPKPSLDLDPSRRLLDLTSTDYTKRLTDRSLTAAVAQQWRMISLEGRQTLEVELRESMAAEADSYIAALQPAFEEAFDVFRQATSVAGLTVTTTIEQAITLEPAAVAMWRLLSSNLTASILNSLLGLRIRVTTALRIAPTDLYGDSCAQLVGAEPTSFAVNRGAGWQRWLAVAQTTPAARLMEGGR